MLQHKLARRASSPGANKLNNLLSGLDDCMDHAAKRRKTAPSTSELSAKLQSNAKDDTMDPVERLLSLTSLDGDILLNIDASDSDRSCSSYSSYSSICSDDLASPCSDIPAIPYSAAHHNISYNFSKVFNDNLRSYYSSFRKSQIEIHNDHSLFSVLTRPRVSPAPFKRQKHLRSRQVPFFKNVNFNPSPEFGNKLEDYIDYNDDDEEVFSENGEQNSSSSDSSPISSPLPTLHDNHGKMSFHYRRNDGLNLSLTDEQSPQGLNEGLKFLNSRSIISGQASETIGAAKFMVNEFFF